ncbi:uncharacterized protein [Penaeus vannamei]|uniref:Uncharacterized protein n=1 Tax=Penaeus vannamei TaxID=6689 RepID=A0A3R7PKT6_PENVA|nr:uncharacterized protein LOC113814342 [Penaeus vannamei]ROT69779.1 hypothetical protein C7M84_011994 [Penaeus vannamei]
MSQGQRTADDEEDDPPAYKLFVTNLHIKTRIDHILRYVRRATDEDPLAVHRIEPLEGQNFVSFTVTCELKHKDTLLRKEVWPLYARVRKFSEMDLRRPAPAQRNIREQRLRDQWK